MRAALYLRVSNDDRAVSLDAQEEGGRAWCAREGHAVVTVYRDDGVSGAEWTHRPGIVAMLAEAERSPRRFDLIVVRDLDRLGRDRVRLPLALSDLAEAGVSVVEWSSGRQVDLSDEAFVLVQLRAHLAAGERRQIAQRTRTALRQRAERGDVAGAKVYGYRHVREGDRLRYALDEAEATVVREIYERAAAGESGRAIARALDARGVKPPRADAWASATVHTICRSARYRGEATWGRRSTMYRLGSIRSVEREAVTCAVPPIVDEDLWQRAQARSVAVARTRPSHEPRHLLVGFVVCATCNGPIATWKATRLGPAAVAYRCGRHADRGAAACPETFARRAAPYDRGAIETLDKALAPASIRAVAEVTRVARKETKDTRREELEAIVARAEQRAERLARAIEHSDDDVADLVARRKAAKAEAEAARAQFAALPPMAPVFDLAAERAMIELASDLRGSLFALYDCAEGGDMEAMRRLRRVVGAAIREPLKATVEGPALVMRGVMYPGGSIGLSSTPTGPGQRHADPLAAWAVPVAVSGYRR